jgi:hypothetical protein
MFQDEKAICLACSMERWNVVLLLAVGLSHWNVVLLLAVGVSHWNVVLLLAVGMSHFTFGMFEIGKCFESIFQFDVCLSVCPPKHN